MPNSASCFFLRIIIASLLLSTTFYSSAGEKAFRVCADPKHPPFSDKQGSGFENKIAELFAQELGKKLEYTWFPQRLGFIRNTLKAKLPNKDIYKCDIVMGVPTGYELTLTTKAYYRSTYALIYAKSRGWDDIKSPRHLALLSSDRRDKLRIAMFDRGPGTAWLQRNGMLEIGIPYQSMTGDPNINATLAMEKDLLNGTIDMAILWGPMAGYITSHNPPGTFQLLPMRSVPGMKFDFPISIGVRYGDKARKAKLNELIDRKSEQIKRILLENHVPLVDENGRLL